MSEPFWSKIALLKHKLCEGFLWINRKEWPPGMKFFATHYLRDSIIPFQKLHVIWTSNGNLVPTVQHINQHLIDYKIVRKRLWKLVVWILKAVQGKSNNQPTTNFYSNVLAAHNIIPSSANKNKTHRNNHNKSQSKAFCNFDISQYEQI